MLRAEVQGSTHTCSTNSTISGSFIFIYFASAAVAVDSSHMTATPWSDSVHRQILLMGICVDNVVHGLSLSAITGR